MTYAAVTSHALKCVEIGLVISSLAAFAKEESFKGTIGAIAEKQIIVSLRGEQRPFQVTAETRITLDGQQVKLAQLPVGSPVEVVAVGSGDKMTAKTITAMSLKGASAPAAQRTLPE